MYNLFLICWQHVLWSVCILFLQTSVDSQEACQGPRGVTRQYQIRFQIGSFKVYESVNTTACRAERCSHTYSLLNVDSIPSSYDRVSVAAVNVVGFGAARTCTAQTISELQFIMCSNIAYMKCYHRRRKHTRIGGAIVLLVMRMQSTHDF